MSSSIVRDDAEATSVSPIKKVEWKVPGQPCQAARVASAMGGVTQPSGAEVAIPAIAIVRASVAENMEWAMDQDGSPVANVGDLQATHTEVQSRRAR